MGSVNTSKDQIPTASVGYDAKGFWTERLASDSKEIGVGAGHAGRYLGPLYNRWLYDARRRALRLVEERFGIDYSKAQLLEFGCGSGYWTHYLEDKGVSRYVGIDVAEPAISTLRMRYAQAPHFSFLQMDIGSRMVPNQLCDAFDIGVAFDVLYHIAEDPEFDMAIANMCRCIKPGGIFLATDLFHDFGGAIHIRHRSLARYEQRLVQEGFAVKELFPVFFLLNRTIHYPPHDALASLITVAVMPFIARGLLTLPVYWMDGFLVKAIAANRRDSSSKILVARKMHVSP